jgi:hypothetical protein
MKTNLLMIIVGVIIAGSAIFATFFESPFETEHYDIKISGLKDVYLVGEPYSFSYTISGYGYSCGDREVTYPDENGDTVRNIMHADCNTGQPKTNFVIDSKNESENPSISIKNPGRYNVAVIFDEFTNFEPTQSGKEFHVVEKICDDSDKVQCFSDSFDTCTSAYIKTSFSTVEGDPIYVIGVVESWYDCKLRVYLDTTQDRYGGHSTGILRSICDDVIVKEDYWTITGCNNFDVPPKMEY